MNRRALAPIGYIIAAVGLVACEEGGLVRVEPDLVANPSAIQFSAAPLDTPVVETLRLENRGAAPLTLRTVTATASELSLALPDLPAVLGLNEHVTVEVTYTPASLANLDAVIVVASDDPDTPELRVPVRSTRPSGPALLVCARSDEIPLRRRCGESVAVPFGEVPETERRLATVEIFSVGTESVSLNRIDVDQPEFALVGFTGASSLAAGASRSVVLSFAPTDKQVTAGRLTIESDAGERVVPLTGSGVERSLCVDPSVLDFGEAGGPAPRTGSVTVSACGGSAVTLEGIQVLGGGGRFSSISTLPPEGVQLPATVGVGFRADFRFQSNRAGAHAARARFTSDGGSAVVDLRAGKGSCMLSANPRSIDFEAEGNRREVELVNTGDSACWIYATRIEDEMGRFRLEEPPGTLPTEVGVGGRFVLAATLEPGVDVGLLSASLLVEHGDSAVAPSDPSVFEVPLRFGGGGADGCQLSVLPQTLDFGTLAPGQERAVGLELQATTQSPCTISSVALLPGADASFEVADADFPAVLTGGETVVGRVWFRPTTAIDAATGALEVRSDDANSPVRVELEGRAARPALCVSPEVVEFGPDATSTTQIVDLEGCGDQAVNISSFAFEASDPEITLVTPPPSLTLAPGETFELKVRYVPTDDEGDTAVLRITSDDPARPDRDVRITAGGEIVPPSAGRFWYLWQIDTIEGEAAPEVTVEESEISRMPLQGATRPEPFYGPRNGDACTGCHSVSPDGQFVALISYGEDQATVLHVVDTESGREAPIPVTVRSGLYVSWNPNPDTTPPYQFAYATEAGDIAIASLFNGFVRTLSGADTELVETMPTWGPNGTIAFVRSTQRESAVDVAGPSDLYVVPETGGAAVPVPRASGGGVGRYYPSFSPDGSWLAYTHSAEARSSIVAEDARIHVVAVDGGTTELTYPELNGEGRPNSYPQWSRDGRMLSFSSNRPGGKGSWDIYLVDFDAETGAISGLRNVEALNDAAFQHVVQWSP